MRLALEPVLGRCGCELRGEGARLEGGVDIDQLCGREPRDDMAPRLRWCRRKRREHGSELRTELVCKQRPEDGAGRGVEVTLDEATKFAAAGGDLGLIRELQRALERPRRDRGRGDGGERLAHHFGGGRAPAHRAIAGARVNHEWKYALLVKSSPVPSRLPL